MALPHRLQPNVWNNELTENAREELRALKAYREVFRDIPPYSPGVAVLCEMAEGIRELSAQGKNERERLEIKCGAADLLCHLLGRIKLSWELPEHDAPTDAPK